jgi:hypothetical protein
MSVEDPTIDVRASRVLRVRAVRWFAISPSRTSIPEYLGGMEVKR